MLKNKLKIITILTIIIIALMFPIVRAENETADQTVDTPVPTAEMPISETTPIAENNFKKSDIYLTGENITIDYIIDGNLFVIAKNVTINSQIGGDAFILAESITVGEQGYVFSNLFTLAKNVIVDGIVYDLYSSSQNVTIHGYVYRDIHIASNAVDILGTIGRNAFINCNTLNFTENNADSTSEEESTTPTNTASIAGTLNYSAPTEATIPEGIVAGGTTFTPETHSIDMDTIQDHMLLLGTYVITIFVVWLFCLWLAPKFTKNTDTFLTTKKIAPVILLGILTPIVLILLAVLSFVIGITYILGMLLLFMLIIFILISNAIFVISFTNIIRKKLKIEKTLGTLGILIITSIVLWLIGFIPYVGILVKVVMVILGLGIITSSLFLKEKNIVTQEEITSENESN